jgi:hypothetical protein
VIVKLARPFFRLPLKLDVDRLRGDVATVPLAAWAPHPGRLPGNSSVRLIAVDGAENDAVDGEMLPTRHLDAMPYVRQVLASFGVVFSRSRLMRLEPHSRVPEHSDINYHWFTRVRLHMPVVTHPDVTFHCGDETVHMAAGEVWLFDNWRIHHVENPTPHERIHLVADTSGSAAFWRFVAASGSGQTPVRELRYDPAIEARPLTERAPGHEVMAPAEVEWLLADLRADLAVAPAIADGQARIARYVAVLDTLVRDWRQLYALHGEGAVGRIEFTRLRDSVRQVSASLAEGLVMRSNRVAAQQILEARVLTHLLSKPARRPAPHRARPVRPIIVVAAPRSGSTLLYETLAVTPQLHTLGGEAHRLIESHAELRPGAPGVDSNRLTADMLDVELEERILDSIAERAVDAVGASVDPTRESRFLEKTPKNALRIPFFAHLFPDAYFVHLWRDPRESIASIIEAWRAGRWVTYPTLDGWIGPWSLLLPPGWRSLRGAPIAEVAAYQWEATNRIVLDDLASLPRQRCSSVSYAEFVAAPEATIRRLCGDLDLAFDKALAARVESGTLPFSRFTQTAPSADKWRRHERAIESVLPAVQWTWNRLRMS